MISACFFTNVSSLVTASDEDCSIRSSSSGYTSPHTVSPDVCKKETFPDILGSILKEIPFLSQKERLHFVSPQLREAFSFEPSVLKQCNIVLGTGLKCLHAKSNGVPFDVLGFIAAAEKTRRLFGFGNVIHYIGDNHAKSCGFNQEGFSSQDELDHEARQQKILYEKIAEKLGIKKTYKVVLASDFQGTSEFLQIKREVFDAIGLEDETEYTKLEVADIEYLRKYQDVRIKFSWVMHEEKDAKRDECSYDLLYKNLFGTENMSFLYARSGVNLSKRKTSYTTSEIDAVPYSYPQSDTRITLRPADKFAEEKIKDFSKLFDFRLTEQDEETLKQKYIDAFSRFLKRKASGFMYPTEDMYERMCRLSENASGITEVRFDDIDEKLVDVSLKVLKERDEVLAKYQEERHRKLVDRKASFQLVVRKMLSKYQDIVDAILTVFPNVHQGIKLSNDSSLETKIQSIIDYFTKEEEM